MKTPKAKNCPLCEQVLDPLGNGYVNYEVVAVQTKHHGTYAGEPIETPAYLLWVCKRCGYKWMD